MCVKIEQHSLEIEQRLLELEQRKEHEAKELSARERADKEMRAEQERR